MSRSGKLISSPGEFLVLFAICQLFWVKCTMQQNYCAYVNTRGNLATPVCL